ncbi:MAG: glycine C-acetyltransferase [Candidatus Marinimicrobia bacterium]|nr:glycine C-acetyltransferase [Candidatus Neomarinimicrobiota bacterium]
MSSLNKILKKELDIIKERGLYKSERLIFSPQNSKIIIKGNNEVLNFCANNYLGLSNHPDILNAAINGIKKYGFGLSSVRFICGTQTIHDELEKQISKFLNKENTILYTSCFDANGGLFETLFNENDAIISDQLNHASIIDGIRLCKAKRFRYANSNMEELESILKRTAKFKQRIITTDGVFSMDGFIAKLDSITSLAKKYNAIVHVDDSHATGFIGPSGKGSADYHNVLDKVDIITSTLGKALGGASGGFTSASNEIINTLRQRSRPYLFSNSLAPNIVCASLKALEIIQKDKNLQGQLKKNTIFFRNEIKKIGFEIKDGEHPIVPIMIRDAKIAQKFASDILKSGIYVIAFSYPVVPQNEARIRVQISTSHTLKNLKFAIKIFKKYGEKYNLI